MARADLHTAKRAARLFFTKWVDGAMSSSQNPPLPGGSTAEARHPTPPPFGSCRLPPKPRRTTGKVKEID